MFGVGFTELLAIAVIALIFIGPEDLPRFARNLGRILNELKRSRDNFVSEFKSAADLKNFNKIEGDIKSALDLEANQEKNQTNSDTKEDSSYE
jgi:sec-independent protein translocase protein TatB